MFSELLVSTHKSTRHHNPDGKHGYLRRLENLKFQTLKKLLWLRNEHADTALQTADRRHLRITISIIV
jgi:hypothetical protein